MKAYANSICARVSDPHHFNADPDQEPDLDLSFHFNADPDPNPTFHFNADPDPNQTFTFSTDPDPVPHQGDANLRPLAYRHSRPPF